MQTVDFCKKYFLAGYGNFRNWMGDDKRSFFTKELNSLLFDYALPFFSRWGVVLSICIFTLFIWALGVILLDFPAPNFFAKFFADREQLQNIFSPIAAFFSGLSAIATSYLIYLQMKTIEKNDIEANKLSFERQFFLMFQLRNEIVSSLRNEYPNFDGQIEGKNNFFIFYNVLHSLFCRFFWKEKLTKDYIEGKYPEADKIVQIISEQPGMRLLLDVDWSTSTQRVLPIYKSIIEAASEYNSHMFSPYFHNVYTTLKLINDNSTLDKQEKDNYIRLFRAQLTQHEFMLIYLHALQHVDTHEKKCKFKDLIENTCFFHSLLDEFIFIESKDKEFELRYKRSAFEHS